MTPLFIRLLIVGGLLSSPLAALGGNCAALFQSADQSADSKVDQLPPEDVSYVLQTAYWLKTDAASITSDFGMSLEEAQTFLARVRVSNDITGPNLLARQAVGRGWSDATRADMIGRIQNVFAQPAYTFDAQKRKRQQIESLLNVVRALQEPRQRSEAERIRALESLGYRPVIAERIARAEPAFADDIIAYAKANAKALGPMEYSLKSAAEPEVLYRRLAIPGGISGFDPKRVVEEWFSRGFNEAESRDMIGGDNATIPMVVIEIQLPRFAHSYRQSPAFQDNTWPVIYPQNMPNRKAPNLGLYILRIGERLAGEQHFTFQNYEFEFNPKGINP